MEQIFKYNKDFENDIINLLIIENWEEYTAADKIQKFRNALNESAVYAAYIDGICCGYIRAVKDNGLAMYVSDLLVLTKYRNKGIGERLLKKLKQDNFNTDIYVLSDEDKYYIKKGFVKCGSIFNL